MNKLTTIIQEDVKSLKLPKLNGKVVIVTGASGLLGNYFLASLKHTRAKIVAVSKSGLPVFAKKFLNKDSKELIGDLTNTAFIKKLPKADLIIHAAGYGQPGKFLEDPIKTLLLNTTVTAELLEKIKPPGKFLFISSSEVYSGLEKPPFREDQIGTTTPYHFRSCYIEGKRGGEAIVQAYRDKGVNAKSARLALAYGPGTKPGDQRVLNIFIQKGLDGKINLQDFGQAFRTYIYIVDAINILFKILFFGSQPVYNVGGNSRLTIAELAQEIGNCLNVPVAFPLEDKKISGAPDDVFLDMSKVKNEFGTINYVTLKKGLKKTIEWQKERYKNEKNK